jgi:hypothetical protein
VAATPASARFAAGVAGAAAGWPSALAGASGLPEHPARIAAAAHPEREKSARDGLAMKV